MVRVLGIDLGTTNSCVAIFDDKKPEVIANPNDERTTPSVVCLRAPENVVVGASAKRQAVTSPEHTIFGIKRLIGRKVNTEDVDRFASTAPFAIVAAKNGDAWVRMPGRDISPQEVSAYVLEAMRKHAEAHFGEPITQAVITVPAYFNDAQRQATKDAGRIAGLDVRRILNEPTAAALAYGTSSSVDRTLVVFDLGGGTFDISILRVDQGLYEVLAVSGDMMLGGDDFDRVLVETLIAEFAKEHGINLSDDPTALGRLREESEKTRRSLSAEKQSVVRLPFLVSGPPPISLEREVSRDELEELVRPLLDRLRAPCERALADAKLSAPDVDEVLLVGGMTRMPAVQAEVESIFSRKPSKGANPDEVVALGAAIHGGILQGKVNEAVLLDVTPKSLGIRVGQNRFSVVIPRNTPLPARATRAFATSRDDQAFVAVELYQGDSEVIKENRLLGRLRLDGLPKGPAGSVRVSLLFFVDVDGILDVVAREMSTGRQTSLRVAPSGGLSEEEFEKIIEQRRQCARST